jgi:hypothetical protein
MRETGEIEKPIADGPGENVYIKDIIDKEDQSSADGLDSVIKSKGGDVRFTFDSQKHRVIEFLKVLSTAHDCMADESKGGIVYQG